MKCRVPLRVENRNQNVLPRGYPSVRQITDDLAVRISSNNCKYPNTGRFTEKSCILYMLYHNYLIKETLPLMTEIFQEFIYAKKSQIESFFVQDFYVKRPGMGSLQLFDEIRICHDLSCYCIISVTSKINQVTVL